MTITEFIEARLAEDEALAHEAAHDSDGESGWRWPSGTFDVVTTGPGKFVIAERLAPDDAAHIAHHYPARVLAQVAALRAVLALHYQVVMYTTRSTRMVCVCQAPRTHVSICPTVRHIATIWADHPDYDQEWRP